MTELLEQVIAKLRILPTDRQDAIAALILDKIEDDQCWDDFFTRSPDLLAKLAAEASTEFQSGATQEIDIEVVRTEALRKSGRNIVNLSKIEGLFKFLLSVSRIEGNAEEIQKQVDSNSTKLHKQTLGKLIQKFYKDVLVNTNQMDNLTTSSTSGMTSYIKVAYDDADSLEARKRSLSDIVTERNNLIHHDLAALDTTRIEDYQRLIQRLDEQNPRLLSHVELLGGIINHSRNSMNVIADYFASLELP
jgi:hypothetical protein